MARIRTIKPTLTAKVEWRPMKNLGHELGGYESLLLSRLIHRVYYAGLDPGPVAAHADSVESFGELLLELSDAVICKLQSFCNRD